MKHTPLRRAVTAAALTFLVAALACFLLYPLLAHAFLLLPAILSALLAAIVGLVLWSHHTLREAQGEQRRTLRSLMDRIDRLETELTALKKQIAKGPDCHDSDH